MLRRDLALFIDALLRETEEGDDLSLDDLATRLFAHSPSQDELDEILVRLETHGRTVGHEPNRAGPKERIARMLDATRALRMDLGRLPTEREVAARSGLSLTEVRATRLLVRVMRGP